MSAEAAKGRVLQMRLVVEAADYDEAVTFYRDVLGAPVELAVDGDAGERVTILDPGRASLASEHERRAVSGPRRSPPDSRLVNMSP